jgi:hypothetical protein
VDILVARTAADLEMAFERLSTAEHLGCDTETSGFSAVNNRLYSVQFSDGEFSVLVQRQPYSQGISQRQVRS